MAKINMEHMEKMGKMTKIYCFFRGIFLHCMFLTKIQDENRLFWPFTKWQGCGIIARQRESCRVVSTVYRPLARSIKLMIPTRASGSCAVPFCFQPPCIADQAAIFLFLMKFFAKSTRNRRKFML